MSNKLEALFQLQILDTGLQARQRIVTRYESELAARKAAMDDCTARMDALLAQRKAQVVTRALAERQVEDLQETLKQKRQRAQKARNEKEVRAGQDEVTAGRGEIDEAETALLEAMTRVEELEAAVQVIKKERADLETEDHRHVAEAQARIDALRAEIDAERAVRDAAAVGIEASLMKKYDFLIGKRGGLAVAEVDGTGCCVGCHVQVPPQTLMEIRRSGLLRVCPMCQRILFAAVLVDLPVG